MAIYDDILINHEDRITDLEEGGGGTITADKVGYGSTTVKAALDSNAASIASKQDASTAINTSNIGSQSVSYAASAGNADTLDSYHASSFAKIGTDNNLMAHGNEFNFAASGQSGAVYLNYRTAGGTNGNITSYLFGNGKGGTLGTAIHSGNIGSQSVNYASSAGSASSATTASQCVCGGVSGNTGIYSGNGDSTAQGTGYANLFIKSWYGVGFVDGCTGQGMTAGIDCRTGNFWLKGIICSPGTYNNTTSTAANLNIHGTSKNFCRYTGSSRRWKENIVDCSIDEIRGLYDVPLRKYNYKEDRLVKTDERYMKTTIGLIAEEINEVLPIAVDHEILEDGTITEECEMWNNNIIVPCLLGLIQDLNKRVKELEEKSNECDNEF